MPEVSPPSLPGASGEEILRQMLPVVVEAVTKSAEGQVSVAAALQALEGQVSELKAAVQNCQADVRRLADAEALADKRKQETGKWLRSLVKFETVYYTALLLLAVLGFRLSQAQASLLPPLPAPFSQILQQEQSP